jgi:hypothetical protein
MRNGCCCLHWGVEKRTKGLQGNEKGKTVLIAWILVMPFKLPYRPKKCYSWRAFLLQERKVRSSRFSLGRGTIVLGLRSTLPWKRHAQGTQPVLNTMATDFSTNITWVQWYRFSYVARNVFSHPKPERTLVEQRGIFQRPHRLDFRQQLNPPNTHGYSWLRISLKYSK